jgi:hypothetical protein
MDQLYRSATVSQPVPETRSSRDYEHKHFAWEEEEEAAAHKHKSHKHKSHKHKSHKHKSHKHSD